MFLLAHFVLDPVASIGIFAAGVVLGVVGILGLRYKKGR